MDTLRENGFPDTPELHSATGGLYAAVLALGTTVGPLIGGSLTKQFNFGSAVALLGFLFMVLGSVVTTYTIAQWYSKKRAARSGPPSDVTH